MGAIHVHELITLDGVIDAPTWTFDYGFLPEMGEAIGAVTGRSREAAPRTLSLAACEPYESAVVYLAYRPQA